MSKIPWNNSWLQMAAFAAILSGIVLILDWHGDLRPGGSGGTNNNNSNGNPSNNGTPTTVNVAPQDAHAWANSLGMKFVPAGTSGVLFSIWDTRVQDFQQFVNETGYNATQGMYSPGNNGVLQQSANNNWSNQFYQQTPDCPVAGVSWTDANAFCLWLTNKDRQAGLITDKQVYRLPTDAEWTTAAGNGTYPWGETWPPPANEGNFYRQGDNTAYTDSTIAGTDGFSAASPVGSFAPNAYGLYDMGGDVFQLCQDWYHKDMNPPDVLAATPVLANDGGGQMYRVARGSAWSFYLPIALRAAGRSYSPPDERDYYTGFRVVLTKPNTWLTTLAEIAAGVVVIGLLWWFFKGGSKSPPAS